MRSAVNTIVHCSTVFCGSFRDCQCRAMDESVGESDEKNCKILTEVAVQRAAPCVAQACGWSGGRHAGGRSCAFRAGAGANALRGGPKTRPPIPSRVRPGQRRFAKHSKHDAAGSVAPASMDAEAATASGRIVDWGAIASRERTARQSPRRYVGQGGYRHTGDQVAGVSRARVGAARRGGNRSSTGWLCPRRATLGL